MGIRRQDRAKAARESWVVRLFYDTDGDLRALRALGMVAILAAAVVLGTVMASFAGAAYGPETLTYAALIVFLGIKIPLLVFVFWILMRQGGGYTQAELTASERERVLESLVAQARAARGRPDEAERLQWAAREAWRLADEAPDDQRADATAVAVEISGMRPAPRGTTAP
jgi:predicted permease